MDSDNCIDLTQEPDSDPDDVLEIGNNTIGWTLHANQSTASVTSTGTSEFSDGIDDIIAGYTSAPDEDDPQGNGASQSSSLLGKRSRTEPSASHKKPRLSSDSVDDFDLEDVFIDKPIPTNCQPTSPHIVIFHHERLQILYNTKELAHGAQYELARLLSNKSIDIPQVTTDLIRELGGKSNRLAISLLAERMLTKGDSSAEDNSFKEHLRRLMRAEQDATLPWEEQDLEDERLGIDPDAGLGFFQDDPTWYGGKVHYHAKCHIEYDRNGLNPKHRIELEKAELGPSNRFARQFGSKRLLRVKVVDKPYSKTDPALFKKPFILNGRVFRAFYEKDRTVFMFMTNETFKDGVITANGDGISLMDLINWHNPIGLDMGQAMAKWASRSALGLSTSVPALELDPSNIFWIDDIVSSEGSDMTDGAGIANTATLRAIQKHMGLDMMPTAIQVRIDGVKGLLCRPSWDDLEDTPPRVYLRSSMRKINRNPSLRAHCIIDLLRVSHPRISSRLSPEVIINLAHNGVPLSAFTALMDTNFQELVAPYLVWDGPDAMLELWRTVCSQGNVLRARANRRNVALSRLNGAKDKEDGIDEEDEDGLKTEDDSAAWWPDEVSGQPSSLEETVMYLLCAGFKPQDLPVLREKLFKVLESALNTQIRKCNITVELSLTAFIAPDDDGILEPGEIFFQSSSRNLTGLDGYKTDILTGDVLLTRYPCKLPTDVQKWKAVSHPTLGRKRPDVIIFSVKGVRRPADYLSGGDYDGDKALLIWQPELVVPFRNADLSFSEAPKDIKANFESKNETVGEFLDRCPESHPEHIGELQSFLLNGLSNSSVVGSYSNMHNNASYSLGYNHRVTKRLGYMFCMVLDGAKSGMKVRDEAFAEDKRRFSLPCKWVERLEKKQENPLHKDYAQRPARLRNFIMDDLQNFAHACGGKLLKEVENTFSERANPKQLDEQLAAPWNEAKQRADIVRERDEYSRPWEDLNKIKAHVVGIYAEKNSSQKGGPRTPSKKGASFTSLRIEQRQDLLRKHSRLFAQRPRKFSSANPELSTSFSDEDVDRIKASYAYIYDWEQAKVNHKRDKWTRFPWDMAARVLCRIKAQSLGSTTTVVGDFYEKMKVVSS